MDSLNTPNGLLKAAIRCGILPPRDRRSRTGIEDKGPSMNSPAGDSMHRTRFGWVMAGILLSLGLPALGSVLATVFAPELRLAHLPLHSLIETSGALMAIAIAGILVLEHHRKPDTDHYRPMACALLSMGILDAFHAGVGVGQNFVWLHSIATFAGGVLFACVWVPPQLLSRYPTARIAWMALGISSLIGVASCLRPDLLPGMVSGTDFSRPAQLLNITGGIAFFAAAFYFIRRFHRLGRSDDWLFALHTMLFGAAGILFELSSLWDAAWWWWHGLRFLAYAAALVFAVRACLDAERQALILNRRLTKSNRELDEIVALRTRELKINEERYELAVKGSTDGLWDWDVTTDVVFFSPRFKELMGFEDHEIRNEFHEFETRLHPDDHDQTMAAVNDHLHRQAPYDVEYRLQTKSGEYRWFRARGQAIWNADRVPVRMAGSITDIHERKQSEAALEHEQFLLQTLLSNLPDAIYFKDHRGRFLRISSELSRKLGLDDPRTAIGRSDAEFFPAEYAEATSREEQQIMQSRQPLFAKEEHPQWPDGTESTVLTSKGPLVSRSGEIIGTYGISHDVSALKAAEERFRTVVDTTPVPVLVVSHEGRILLANQATFELFGYEPHELSDEQIETLVPERFRDLHIRLREQFFENPGVRLVGDARDLFGRRKDGTEFPAEVALRPMSLARDPIVLVSVIDLTARKEVEEVLRQAKEAAERANQTKSDFLANMSHEIRTPMNAIIGMSELVLDTSLTATQRDYLTIVLEAAESLLAIINEILDFSKIEAGKLELEFVDFDLREEVGDTLKSLALRAHAKGLELAWQVQADVPYFLKGDPVRLRQILINLVGNAIKFTDQGEVFVDVLPVNAPGQSRIQLEFRVRDTGVGINKDKVDTIFAPFEQADTSTTRQFGGTGLGLTITSRIIEAMGGSIRVESQPGQGSLFCFQIAFDEGKALQHAAILEPPDLSQIPVLIVDDNALNRRILREMLESWGMPVTTVDGGPAALEALKSLAEEQGPAPLLLTDVNMPGMDGFELVKSIRSISRFHDMVVFVLTSGGRPGDIARCEELGVQTHMMKPVKQSELLDAIMVAVGRTVDDTSSSSAAIHAMPSIRILVAEDGRANQRLAKAMLEKWGHEVTIAENGRVAVELWQKHPFDLILMDVQMPVMDGLEATRCIRDLEERQSRHIPIVAMTARAMKGDREKCLESGMDDYVSKPVRKADLYAAIAPLFPRDSEPIATTAVPPPSGLRTQTEQGGLPSATSTTTGNGNGLIDWNGALQVVDGDTDLLHELIRDSLDELPELLRLIEQACEAGETAAAAAHVHTTKSTGRTFVVSTLLKAADALEAAAIAGDLESTKGQLPVFAELIDQVLIELNQRLANSV